MNSPVPANTKAAASALATATPTASASACGAGPLRQATLIVNDAAPLVAAYATLGLEVVRHGQVSVDQARSWGHGTLAKCAVVELGAVRGEPGLLRLIEVPGAPPRPTRFSHGWMALEILVRDVDALAAQLAAQAAGPSPVQGFEVVGPPADLDVSPNIRAMQVVGPAGEMLYLTQVRAAVPPFQIPLSPLWFDGRPFDQHIGPLFIAVMSTPSRATTLQACSSLAPLQTLQFETKITVLNRALDRSLDSRWPVATTQWAGGCLFEIDEVQDPAVTAGSQPGALPAGLAWISMQAAQAAQAPPAKGTTKGGPPLPLQELSPGAWLELLR
jgi:hypothetical protein